MDDLKLRPGDKIRLIDHKKQTLGEGRIPSPYDGALALVQFVGDRPYGYSATVRLLDAKMGLLIRHYEDEWEIVERDCPMVWEKSERELAEERYNEFVAKVMAHDVSQEGFSNPATWMAALYLRQEPTFHAWLKSNYRKNGTVNPSKVEKWFGQSKLSLDKWAFHCPIDIPQEFKSHVIRGLRAKMSVKWGEVALDFKKEEECESSMSA